MGKGGGGKGGVKRGYLEILKRKPAIRLHQWRHEVLGGNPAWPGDEGKKRGEGEHGGFPFFWEMGNNGGGGTERVSRG